MKRENNCNSICTHRKGFINASRQKIKWAVTQYRTCNTWNMTEASWCIYTVIYSLTGPATNHCPEIGLSHLWIVERPNVHIISIQFIIHYYACEHWLIATKPYDRIPTIMCQLFIHTLHWSGPLVVLQCHRIAFFTNTKVFVKTSNKMKLVWMWIISTFIYSKKIKAEPLP